jgi:hypothetical protein
MEQDATSLRQKMIAVLTQRGEPMSYRELTDTLWDAFPGHREHMVTKYETEKEARTIQRVRLGIQVRDNPGVFTATKSEGIVLVGLAATEADAVDDADDEAAIGESAAAQAVYWYTFPAYKQPSGPYPIKIGRGNNPETRIGQQVTAMPEHPDILGTFEHGDVHNLERALHAVLTLQGKRKRDAPGAEFVTTPEEIKELIQAVLGVKTK